MEQLFLDAEVREGVGRSKAKDVRDQGYIPAVVYSEGKNSRPIRVSHKELFHLVHQVRIESAIINLRIKDDTKKSRSCLIKEIQYDPVHGDIMHVDFNEISLTKAIRISVPVAAKGDSVGVKQEGGSLEHILWEVEVECLPTAIPKEIEVDITNLKLRESVFVKDLVLPPGIKVLNDPSSIILTIAEPMKEEVAAPAEGEEGAPAEPEVIKEKKEVPAEGGEEAPKEKAK